MDINAPFITQWDQSLDNRSKVRAEWPLALIQPLHGLSHAEAGHPDLHPVRVPCGVGLVVVDQPHVLDPAVDDGRDHLLQVEPQGVPVGLLSADVVGDRSLVDAGLELGPSVARN